MRVAVTGATGNVGTAVLRVLAAEERVREIVGIARRVPDVAVAKTAFMAADIGREDDGERLAAALEGADVVVHLAWLIQPGHRPEVMEAVNVEGSRRVFAAALAAGAGTIVHASSVGAYSPGPKDRAVAEDWPTGGIPTSTYSVHKARVERILDEVEAEHAHVRVVRLRPGLIFQRNAATEIHRYFLGPLVPGVAARRSLIGVVPCTDRLVFQAVHADDVADAYRRVIAQRDVRGAFNVAADPVLDADALARALRARPVPVPARVLRAAADVSFRARLQPIEPGWLDLARGVPTMDTSRARTELGWNPSRSSADALLELVDGLGQRASGPTPPLTRRRRWSPAAGSAPRR